MPFGERRYCETCGRRCRRLFVQLNGRYLTVGYYCLRCEDIKIGRDLRRAKKPALLNEVITRYYHSTSSSEPVIENDEPEPPPSLSPKSEIEKFKERARQIFKYRH